VEFLEWALLGVLKNPKTVVDELARLAFLTI